MGLHLHLLKGVLTRMRQTVQVELVSECNRELKVEGSRLVQPRLSAMD